MSAVMECVPNVSEGRRPEVIDTLAAVVSDAGARLLDYSADAAHNRSVLTFAGEPHQVEAAALALVAHAVASIDMRTHRGEHPRVGAVDVMPFVPLQALAMSDAVASARRVGATVAERFGLPVYLYEEAASRPERRRLENIRRGQLENLAVRMQDPEWRPDFGPFQPHPTAGAIIIGARRPLIAFNVNLGTSQLDVAARIARTVRESGGGLPAVKAIGVRLAERGIVQVSMNLTNYEETPIERAFDAVKQEAAKCGVTVIESELIGLIPRAALAGTTPEHLQLRDFQPDRILENRLAMSEPAANGR